jgi:hypothetical protein
MLFQPITPSCVKARRLALNLNQTDFAAAVTATYRAYGVEPAKMDASRVSRAENGNPDPGSLLAFSLTLQRLESK